MGTDVFALITQWQPMLEACRSAGGLDFFWQTDGDLPFAVEHHGAGGWAFLAAGHYLEFLRGQLPADLREPADAFLGLLYPEACARPPVADLRADAGVPIDELFLYTMRPATVRAALRHAGEVPWQALETAGRAAHVPQMAGDPWVRDYDTFHAVVYQHHAWLREAAATDRGVLTVISQ